MFAFYTSSINRRNWLAAAIAITLSCITYPSESAIAMKEPFKHNAAVDARGYIDVWALRRDVIAVEALTPTTDQEACFTKNDSDAAAISASQRKRDKRTQKSCLAKIKSESEQFQAARYALNTAWSPKIKTAIEKGDEVAEVIWRQCDTTQILERNEIASTCDKNPVRRKEAALRLRQIGFEAAFDEEAEGNSQPWERDQNKRRTSSQVRTIRQMEAGVYGGWTIDDSYGGNAPRNPQELIDLRRAEVIGAALTLVRRSFTYLSSQNQPGHARLNLGRKPTGSQELAWGANLFYSGDPHTGSHDPVSDGFKVLLQYDQNRIITVGGKHDAQYLRMLYDTLSRSEQRIDYWLARDPRWAVFLLHRQGHHEWIPEGMQSPLGQLKPAWGGEWMLEKRFVNFKPIAEQPIALLTIKTSEAQTTAQFEQAGTASYTCELRYSGGSSYRPQSGNHTKSATDTVLGYLPAIAPITPHEAGPLEPFAPMNPHKAYRQVLVQCPQGEQPDNRNKRFFFHARDMLLEIYKAQASQELTIVHWRRKAPLDAHSQFEPLTPAFNLQPTLARLANDAAIAEQADAQTEQMRAKVSHSSDPDELIASLAQLRLEQPFYDSSRDFPENLTKLVDIPDISIKICAAYRAKPPDALQRFNFMVVINKRSRNELLTAKERSIVPDCLRLALNDSNDWVRLEAVDAFARFAEEKDRAKLMELQHDPYEDVRRYSQNALNRLKP